MSQHTEPDVDRSRKHGKAWASIAAFAAGVATVAAILLFRDAATTVEDTRAQVETQGVVIAQQNGVIGEVCQAAKDRIGANPAAKDACGRVEQGLPAVPTPERGLPGTPGTPGVGVKYVKQLDTCFIEVGLTSGSLSRFGPFCGAPGVTGPPGPSGAAGSSGQPGQPGENATGKPGLPGSDGVGVADVRTSANQCFVEVILTDGSTRTVGPFCGPPLGEFTMTLADGSRQQCVRDGGTDTAPAYQCVITTPPATTARRTTARPSR